jgi:predicted O-methyltransferase YrrM
MKKAKLRFSADYTTSKHSMLLKHLRSLAGKPNICFLEVGAFEGRTHIWVHEHLLTHPSSRSMIIDDFSDGNRKTLQNNLVHAGLRDRVVIVEGPSGKCLRELALHSFDLLYIDGSHHKRDVLVDAVLAWDLLRRGGIVVFDDYLFKHATHADHQPKLALDCFLDIYSGEYKVLHRKYELILQKIGTSYSLRSRSRPKNRSIP